MAVHDGASGGGSGSHGSGVLLRHMSLGQKLSMTSDNVSSPSTTPHSLSSCPLLLFFPVLPVIAVVLSWQCHIVVIMLFCICVCVLDCKRMVCSLKLLAC